MTMSGANTRMKETIKHDLLEANCYAASFLVAYCSYLVFQDRSALRRRVMAYRGTGSVGGVSFVSDIRWKSRPGSNFDTEIGRASCRERV